MERLSFPVLSLVMQWSRLRHNAQPQLLAVQVRILRWCIDLGRIPPTPNEKAEETWHRLGRQ